MSGERMPWRLAEKMSAVRRRMDERQRLAGIALDLEEEECGPETVVSIGELAEGIIVREAIRQPGAQAWTPGEFISELRLRVGFEESSH